AAGRARGGPRRRQQAGAGLSRASRAPVRLARRARTVRPSPGRPRPTSPAPSGRAVGSRGMGRRDLIRLTEAELGGFLGEQRTVVVATVGRDGWPHLMPLWYTVRDGELWSWTYARSQKVKNLERDDRVTLQVEDGTTYDQLRGVMVKANARVHRDAEVVTDF